MINKKTFCVHVHERPAEYENIQAETPEQAVEIIINSQFAGNYDDILHVEVMRQCKCGLDNDTRNEKCEECGEVL